MAVILEFTSAHLVVLLILCSFLTEGRSARTVTKAQVEDVVKRFKTDELYGKRPEKVAELLKCVQSASGCTKRVQELVTNEILLRSLYRGPNETCSSDEKTNKLLASEVPDWNSVDYKAWQDKLIDSGQIFCDPYQHLTCTTQKICECRPGLTWNVRACVTNIGGYCGIPGKSTPTRTYYDPFYYVGDMDSPQTNKAVDDPLCPALCNLELNLFMDFLCADESIRELDQKLATQYKTLPRLNYGDACNPEQHTQFFTSPESEWNDFTIRTKNLEAIFEAKTSFCDNGLLLICGAESKKCECNPPSKYDETKKICTFKSKHELCNREEDIKNKGVGIIGIGKTGLIEGFQGIKNVECPGDCKSESESGVPDKKTPSYCSCPDPGTTGKDCNVKATAFLTRVIPSTLPADIPEYDKQLEAFQELSEKATGLESLFNLKKYSFCNRKMELEAARVIRQIKNLEVTGTVYTKKDYKDIISAIEGFGNKSLCLYRFRGGKVDSLPPTNRPLLVCGLIESHPVCYEPDNDDYLEELKTRLSVFQTLKVKQPCGPDVQQIIDSIRAKLPEIDRGVMAEALYQIFNTLENIFVNETTKFCNRTAGHMCSFTEDKTNTTGKCIFSQKLMDEVLLEQRDGMEESTTAAKSSQIFSSLPVVILVGIAIGWITSYFN